MPLYESLCKVCGKRHEYRKPVAQYLETPECCGTATEKHIFTGPKVYMAMEIFYTSPIDGSPITTKQQRVEDLAKNGCIPYDEGIKKDVARNRAAEEAKTEKAFDHMIEDTFQTMGLTT